MVRLVLIAQAAQDGDGVFHGRLVYLYRLETTLQRRILFNVLAVLIQSGCTNGLQLTTSQLRLQQGSCVNCTFCCTCTNKSVNLIDEQDDVAALVNLLENLLQALFEVTTVTGACYQRTQVKRVNLLVLQGLWNLAINNIESKTLDNSGLTNARFTDKNRVVLGAARQHLHDALNLRLTSNDWVQLAVLGSLGEVAAELI